MVQPEVADVASAAAGAGKDPDSGGGVEASAAPGRKWPRRGPGLSDVPRKSVAQASTEDVQMEEDGAETRGDSTQGESTGASTAGDTGDACGDAEESQHISNALHGQGIGSRVEVVVDPPTTWHTSWEGWQAYLKTYCASTMQVLVVQETMKRDEQNKRLSKTKKGADVSKLIPEGLEPYSRVYICTHGWKKRKSRGTGSRPRQHIRLTNCSFRFRVQWNLERMELQVKNGHFLHNHQVNTSTFATYPSSRGVVDTMVGARVEGMLAVGATRSKIYDYLLEHDQNVIQVDVDNLVREHASSVATEDDNDATAREIAAFAAADPNNVSAVSETASGETGVISLATAHMRRIYGRFSELLLVDCSHKTNRYNYQLLTFMTMNEFGEGAVVQQSLLETNGDWHMERAVGHFKSFHPTQIDRLRVIVVDKDLNEIKVLQSNFPQARVLICHFHVITYLKEKRCKPEFCKVCTDDASQIDAAIHAMVYADSEENYRIFHDSFRGICARVGMQNFFTYFEKNWDASQERWVLYHRSTLPHFKNHTNNRLENFFGKLKNVVDGSMSMAGCVKALVAYDRRMQNEYGYRLARIGQFVNSNYDEEMSNVLRFTSHFVAEQIAGQYTRALSNTDRYKFTVSGGDQTLVVVQGASKTHRLRVDTWECDCEFALTMILPCRHAIAYRKKESIPGPVIPWKRIDQR